MNVLGDTNNWTTIPFWAAFRRVKRTGYPDKDILSVYRDLGVVRKRDRDDNFNVESGDLSPYQLVNRGDLAINKMKAWQGSLGVSPYEGIVSPAYFVFEPTSANDIAFLNHLLRSREFAGLFRAISKGIRPNQWDLDPDQLRTVKLQLPPPDEQRAIADYLDQETARIDTLVAKQEEFIGLLRERRSSLVTHEVSRSVAERSPLRRVVEVIDCAHVTADFVDDDERYPIASIRECQGATVDLADCKYTTEEFYNHLRASGRTPRVGDLLFIRNVSVGLVAAVAPGTRDFAVGQETVLLRRKANIDPTFLRYALTSTEVEHAVEGAMIGATFRRINVSAIRSLPVPVPPINEQTRIASILDVQTARIDTLIAKTEEHIALAKERRSALITEAVTGQIDVRTARKAA